MRSRSLGFSLVEALVTLGVLLTLATLSVPPLLRLSTRHELDLAARDVAAVLRLAESYAVRHSTHVAVRFGHSPQGTVTFTLYRDGDGDGVLTQDIETGVDPQVAPAQPLAHFGRRVRLGFPPGIAPRDPGDPRRRLDRLDDPIRFNRSDLASFSPLGGSTPGSIYLTDGEQGLVAVRVYNRTGKIKLLRYEPSRETWEPD